MKKTIMTVIFSVMCVAACLLMSPAACADYVASGSCGDNLIWRFDSEGLLTISGSGEMQHSISSVDCLGEYRDSVYSVKIIDGVTSIGDEAFIFCRNLTRVTIPSSVESIGELVFHGCSGLTNMTIPSSVTLHRGFCVLRLQRPEKRDDPVECDEHLGLCVLRL